MINEDIVNFGFQGRRCQNCRYYRIHKTVAETSDCLLMDGGIDDLQTETTED